MENIRIEQVDYKGATFYGKWYITASPTDTNPCPYLHADRVWRYGCTNPNSQCTGYFDTKELAEQTLAHWQKSQEKDTKVSDKFIIKSFVRYNKDYKYLAHHPGGGFHWSENEYDAAEFDSISDAAEHLQYVCTSNIISIEINLAVKTHFPILIKFTETENSEERVIDRPEDIP